MSILYSVKNPANTVSLWFGVIMVIMVTAGAFAFLFTDFMADTLSGGRRTFMIIVFIAYALYRGIRIYQYFKAAKHEE
ncbi:MAG: hypothetical protein ACXVPQ_00515 [Bacteroidia bacterium]